MCRSCIDHAPNQIDSFKLLWPTVNEVANEQCLSIRMSPRTSGISITQVRQQRFERICVTVNVSNDVVVHDGFPVVPNFRWQRMGLLRVILNSFVILPFFGHIAGIGMFAHCLLD